MTKRIRYSENEDGTVLTSPKYLAGKVFVVAHLNLKTGKLSVQNTDTMRHIGESINFKSKADAMKKAKTILKALGVVFYDEKRVTEKTKVSIRDHQPMINISFSHDSQSDND